MTILITGTTGNIGGEAEIADIVIPINFLMVVLY
jgi:hypothetical protein